MHKHNLPMTELKSLSLHDRPGPLYNFHDTAQNRTTYIRDRQSNEGTKFSVDKIESEINVSQSDKK